MRSYRIMKGEADNQISHRRRPAIQRPHQDPALTYAVICAKSGDIRVHRLSMTARRDENALSRAVRILGIACAAHAMENSSCMTITLATRCRPPSTAMR